MKYILKRILHTLLILFIITTIVFVVLQVLPGNVAKMVLGQFATPESLAALEEKLGLNDPLIEQYWHWFSRALKGDLGTSIVIERPVTPLLIEALKKSGFLALVSIFLVGVIGNLLGILSAVKQDKFIDVIISLFVFVGISIPEYFLGIILVILFSNFMNLFPSSGYIEFSFFNFWEWTSHLVLPVVTLTYTLVAHITRMSRASMISVLQSNYIKFAEMRGLTKNSIIFKHALKNALIPSITVLALDFGWMIGGIVLVETVFAYPGFGRLLVFGIMQRDLPVMQACMLVIAIIYCFANLIADLLYTYVDPRIRYGETKA